MPDASTYRSHDPAGQTRECPECGLFQSVPALRPGLVADCVRCGALLRRRRRDSLTTVLALSLAGIALFGIAAVSPFLTFRLLGQAQGTTLATLPGDFVDQGYSSLALGMVATTLAAPLAKLLLTVGLIAGLREDINPAALAFMARWRVRLGPWAMIEVFLLGAFVAYTRLVSMAAVDIGVAMYALGALMLVSVTADAWLDEHALWDAIGRLRDAPAEVNTADGAAIGCDTCGQVSRAPPGDGCPRCGSALHVRKPDSIARTWALLIAAAAFYVPANLYPVLTLIRFGAGHPSTILGGVVELVEYKMWPLALLVFVASVLVPLLKLVGIAFLLITTQRGATWRLRDRTRLYRVVEVVGRWSMIDIFMLAVLVGLVRMGIVASVYPGLGAVCFGACVILTMLASFSFDPRLMWDAAGRTACDAEEAEERAQPDNRAVPA